MSRKNEKCGRSEAGVFGKTASWTEPRVEAVDVRPGFLAAWMPKTVILHFGSHTNYSATIPVGF